MKTQASRKPASPFLWLAMTLCLVVFNPLAASAGTDVTWTFMEMETLPNGNIKMKGVLTNNSNETITHVDRYMVRFNYAGQPLEVEGKQSVELAEPVPTGGQLGFGIPMPNPKGEKLENFRVEILAVRTASGAAPAAQPAPKPAAQPTAKPAAKSDSKSAASAAATAAAGEQLERELNLRLRHVNGSFKIDGDAYVLRVIAFNNSNEALREVTVNLRVQYKDGEVYDKNLTFTPKNPIQPNTWGGLNLKAPYRGTGTAGVNYNLVKAAFEPAREPEWQEGPKKGNLLWTPGKMEVKDGKLQIAMSLLNNGAEDIVAINTYTVTFDHDDGRQVRRGGNWTLASPVQAYAKGTLTLGLGEAVYNNPRNVKISDVTYMSRPTSARPAPPKAAAPAQKSSPSSGGQKSASAQVKVVGYSWDKQERRTTVTIEVLNNSTTQTLVRLDNPVFSYVEVVVRRDIKRDEKKRRTLETMTVNIPPLGVKKFSFKLAEGSQAIKQKTGVFSCIYRFADPPQKRNR